MVVLTGKELTFSVDLSCLAIIWCPTLTEDVSIEFARRSDCLPYLHLAELSPRTASGLRR